MPLNKEAVLSLSASVSKVINSPITPAGYSFGLKTSNTSQNETTLKSDNPISLYVFGDLITPSHEISKTILEEEDLYRRVNDLELLIHNRARENILAIDACGNVTMHVIGEESRVMMEKEHWNNAKIVTHNHPNGATLSGADVSCLFTTECKEIRACSFNTWYSIKRHEDTADLDGESVREEVTELLTERIIEAAEDACSNNDIELTVHEDTRHFQPIRPQSMTQDEFRDLREKTEREFRVLSVIYTHAALKDYADENNIVYKVGEL